MNERMNAHVVQARKQTDQQGQEITAASSSLLASIKKHKEEMRITIENLNREISKSKECVDSNFSKISWEIHDIKQHGLAKISRLSAILGDLQAKQWLSSSFDKLKVYNEFKKAFTELLWNPSRQASIRSSIYLNKYNSNSGESYMDHYIRSANLASTLDPPMTETDLLSALTSHFEPRVQQGLISGNFKNSRDALAFLSKFQGLGESRESFTSPR
jgi:predicted HNH restriction endonuclease